MKTANLMVLFAAVVIIAGVAVWNMSTVNSDVPKIPGPSKIGSDCAQAGGAWLAQFSECQISDPEWCFVKKGRYNECASACRHDPKAQFCTEQCIPVCSF